MTIKPRNTDPTRVEVDERDRLIRPLNHHTANPLFEGWGPKL